MHVAWLMGASSLFALARDAWKGTLHVMVGPAGTVAGSVLTVGVLQAGSKENVIPDEAVIKLNVRTFDESVRARVLAAIERIVNAEAEASGATQKLCPRVPTQSRRTRASANFHAAVCESA